MTVNILLPQDGTLRELADAVDALAGLSLPQNAAFTINNIVPVNGNIVLPLGVKPLILVIAPTIATVTATDGTTTITGRLEDGRFSLFVPEYGDWTVTATAVYGDTTMTKTATVTVDEVTIFEEDLSIWPYSFTELEYIEGTGTQYLYLNYYMNTATKIVVDQQFTSTEVQGRFFRAESTAGVYESYINGSGYWAYGHQNNTGNWVSTNVTADTDRHTMTYDTPNCTYTISGTSVSAASMTGTLTLASTAKLGILTSKLDGVISGTKAKLYSIEIYENNVLVASFIPCRRNSDNVAGLYDTINDVFYTNAGTGTFVQGPEVVEEEI